MFLRIYICLSLWCISYIFFSLLQG
jgi:hypothetical protein